MLPTQKSPHNFWSMQVLFWVAILVRIWLAIFNRESNDPHIEVVELLRAAILQGSYPTALGTCLECYHPKLYYLVCALFLVLFRTTSASAHIIISQLINAIAFSIALIFVRGFFEESRLPTGWKILGFGLFAFSPALIEINMQVTNDTFAISFGVFATHFFLKFLKSRTYRSLFSATFFLILGLLSKGNFLVIFTWMLACLILRAVAGFFSNKDGSFWLKSAAFLCLSTGVAIALVGWPISVYQDYAGRWSETGRLSAVNFEKHPRPHFFEKIR